MNLATMMMTVRLEEVSDGDKTYYFARAELPDHVLKTAVDETLAKCWQRVFQEERSVEEEVEACLKARNHPMAVLTYASLAPVDPAEFREGFLRQCARASATFFSTFVAFKKISGREIPLCRVGIAQGYDESELTPEKREASLAYLEEKQCKPLYLPSPNEAQIGVVSTFDSRGEWDQAEYWEVKSMACALGSELMNKGYEKPYNWTQAGDGSYFDPANRGRPERVTVTNPVADLYTHEDRVEQDRQREMLGKKSEILGKIGLQLLGYLAPKELDPRNYGSSVREVWGYEKRL